MSVSAWAGPLIQFGAEPYGSNLDVNPDRGPAMLDLGMMILDPRVAYTYLPGQPVTRATMGFVDGEYICVDATPSAIAANNIAASQSPGAGAINLVVASGAGITVGVSITRADTGVLVSGLLAIDGLAGGTTSAGTGFGSNAQVQSWNPAQMLSRTVRITSGGNDSGISFTVNGYDVYGFPMTQTVTGANAGVATTLKTFKYITSVTHTGSVATTVTIGTGDTYGFPLQVNKFFYIDIYWNNAYITSNTGFTVADQTNPATVSTGDVRGSYAVQTASDGTKQLQMMIMPSVANLASGSTGLFGVTQV
jgi:hypothetical protein